MSESVEEYIQRKLEEAVMSALVYGDGTATPMGIEIAPECRGWAESDLEHLAHSQQPAWEPPA